MVAIFFLSFLAICAGSTPRPRRTLERQNGYVPDVCYELCQAFEADRRGDGFNLCNFDTMSRCVTTDALTPPYCENLYWSLTDDGQPGIVYSDDGSDLTEIERSNYVFCEQAEQILDPMIFVDAYTSPASSVSRQTTENSDR